MTLDTYTHFMPSSFKEEVDDIDRPVTTLQNGEVACT